MSFYEIDDETPSFITSFFNWFEKNIVIARLVGIPDKYLSNEPLISSQPLRERLESMEKEDIDMYQAYVAERRPSGLNLLDQEKFLAKKLPKRVVIAVNRQLIKKITGPGTVKYYFRVITQIEQFRFEVERKYGEFKALEGELKEIFNQYEYPSLSERIPVLEKHQIKNMNEFDKLNYKRMEALEAYLTEIFETPQFVHKRVLDFLQINNDEVVAPYFAFGEFIMRTKKVKMAVEMKNLSKKELSDEKKLNHQMVKKKPNFRIEGFCFDWMKSSFGVHYEYIFKLTYCQVDGKGMTSNMQSWTISRSYPSMKDFNEKLENQIGISIPFFNMYVPKEPKHGLKQGSKEFLDSRKNGLDSYVKAILNSSEFYCKCFFDFFEFSEEEGHASSLKESTSVFELKREISESAIRKQTPKFVEQDEISNLIDTSSKRICYGVDFARVTFEVNSFQRGSNKDALYYIIDLIEYNNVGNSKTFIRVKKSVDDIFELCSTIKRIYSDLDLAKSIPHIGANVSYDGEAGKDELFDYFNELLKVPKIENNLAFQDFFNLSHLNSNYKNLRDDLEVYDFTKNK